ncbi:hypothetical protein ACIP5Y_15675 [Nocardia sp. NPDC088792]|uniref:hypothetical protein n=1 Tax=Nocardia sp. NPDC088792 TaxID=3364332 RepID=UPI00380A8D97
MQRITTVLYSPMWTQKPLHIPGFITVQALRQVSDFGMAELDILYEDTQATTVTTVTFTGNYSPIQPAPGLSWLGTIMVGGWQPWYVGYTTSTAPITDQPRTLVLTSQLAGEIDAFVPGLVSVDQIVPVDEYFKVAIYITYNPTGTTAAPVTVSSMRFLSGDLDPVNVSGVHGVQLGTVTSPQFGWRHVYYTATPVMPSGS